MCVCVRVHAPSFPPPLLSFICFPFQPLHEVMNAWVWFFFLPPLPLPSSHASSLFLNLWSVVFCFFWGFIPRFYYYIWFIFVLPPPFLPCPSLLFCDTASWDRSGRQPRSHTGQSTSHLNQSINQSVNQYITPSSQSHNASFWTLPFPTHPTDLPTLQLPRPPPLFFTLLNSFSPFLSEQSLE